MNVGKRYLFFDVLDGEILVNEARSRLNIMPTVERVIEIYPILHERLSTSYEVLILNYDDFLQEFAESNGYRVNVETKTLEFSYPDPNAPEAPPVFQKPLSEQIKELENQQRQTNEDLSSLMDFVLTGGM